MDYLFNNDLEQRQSLAYKIISKQEHRLSDSTAASYAGRELGFIMHRDQATRCCCCAAAVALSIGQRDRKTDYRPMLYVFR